MVNLIKNELIKIFHKKSFYIITLIFILYCILTNVIYRNNTLNPKDDLLDIASLTKTNETLDLNDSKDLEEYITNLSLIKTTTLKKEYPSFQFLIEEYFTPVYYELYQATYLTKDQSKINSIEKNLSAMLVSLKKHDWSYFTQEKIAYEKNILKTSPKESLKYYETIIKLEEYRLKHKVGYDSKNYLFTSLNFILINLKEYENYQNKSVLSHEEKTRFENLKEQMTKNAYILKNQVDINNPTSLNRVLENFAQEFGIFILIYGVMLSGGLIAEEFSKGTIKNLLTTPSSRLKILSAKLLTVLFLLPLIMLIMVLIELLIGGLVLGFSSLSNPVLIYSANKLYTLNIFSYLTKYLLAVFPSFLVLTIICFALSTLTLSTSAAITITFLFYILGNVISNLMLIYNFSFLKWFISLHWSFSYLVLHQSNPYHFSLFTSIFVLIIYITVILCLTYFYFQKKDVKNI